MRLVAGLAGAILLALSGASARVVAQQSEMSGSPLVIEQQGSFFIGGTVRHAEELIGVRSGRDITTGQMYVQYQIPVSAKHLPIVMIHGGGLSGQVYETTPDGRMGWSEYFVRAGRPVYVVDQAGRGRSGFDSTDYKDPASVGITDHERAWTYFRIGPKFGTPFPDSQFPITAVDAFYKMLIPDLNALLPTDNPSYADLAALSQKVGGAVLLGHSESFMFPERAALLNPAAVKGIINLESGYACAASFTQAERAALARIPILIVFADHLADAAHPFDSQWTRALTQCREFGATIRQLGGDVTFVLLPESGIRGNSHMFMVDKNNLQIAGLLRRWIDAHVEHSGN